LKFFPELIEEVRLNGGFQQDNFTAYARIQALSDIFEDRVFSSGISPARSPDLNPYDLFLLVLFEGQSLQQ
jgi:hypothetical protein